MAKITATFKGGDLDGQSKEVEENRYTFETWEKNSLDIEPGEKEVKKLRIHTYKRDKEQNNTEFAYDGWRFEEERNYVASSKN
jgi:hypothetical protein